MACALPSTRPAPGKISSKLSAAPPTYPTSSTISIIQLAPSFDYGGTKVSRSTPTPNRGPTSRRTSASSEGATNPLTSIPTSCVKRWPSSSKTDSGPSSRTTWSDTSWSSCSLPRLSRRNGIARPAYCATTPGLGGGLLSMSAPCPTLLPRPCSSERPCPGSSTTFATRTRSSAHREPANWTSRTASTGCSCEPRTARRRLSSSPNTPANLS